MNNLEEIRDEIVRKGFPEFMSEEISIEYVHLEDAFMACGDLTDEGHYIEVDPRFKDAPRKVVIGGVAHEFSHLLDNIKRNRDGKAMDALLYKFSKTYSTAVERNTDLQVIMRGFGRELLSFLRYAEGESQSHYKECGLSHREVETILLGGK